MDENKRAFFRLTHYEKPIEVTFQRKTYEADMRDVSGNGISFYSTDAYPVNEDVFIAFQMEKKEYGFTARILREQEGTLGRRLYAASFLNQTPKQQSELSAHLLRLEASRRKS